MRYRMQNINTNHIMLDSIFNTPSFIEDCFNSTIDSKITELIQEIKKNKINRIICIGCGTSLMVAQASVHIIRRFTSLDAISFEAFEFLNYPLTGLSKNDMIFGFSHSGGTKAVVDSITECNKKGIKTVGFYEVDNSRLAANCDIGFLGPGGKDKATPKTRSFITQLIIILMIANHFNESNENYDMASIINLLPNLIQKTISEVNNPIKSLAKKYKNIKKFFICGSGINSITSREGSLKILEAGKAMSIGLELEEMAHGNDLILSEDCAVIIIKPFNNHIGIRIDHIINGSITTGAKTCVFYNGPALIDHSSIDTINISTEIDEVLSIFLFIIPFQLFAYYYAIENNLNPDNPKEGNEKLAKAISEYNPPGYH